VHNGHLAIARMARDHFGFEQLLLIPAGTPPHKAGIVRTSATDRLAMLRLAVGGEPGMLVWNGEIVRSGPSYTIDTVAEIRRLYPKAQIHLIIGADNLREIRTWHRYAEVLPQVVLCVTERPGYELCVPEELSAARISAFPSPHIDASSSQVRALLAKRQSCAGLIPDSVLAYINEKGLYRHASASPA
jgi:nicotinate-nucleotide adenylyltransferase